MGDHLESITTRVRDFGVSRHSGRAVWSMHEEPRGSGDVGVLGPHAGHGVSRDTRARQ